MQNNSKKKQLVKAGIGYTVGNYLLKGLAFFSIPIFSRLMTTSDYGMFNTFSAYEAIIFVVIGLALHSSFKNAKYKYSDDFDSFVSTCITVAIISFIVWLLFSNVFYFAYGDLIGFSRPIVNMLIICSMGSALVQYYNVYSSIDYRYDRFIRISAFNAISSIILSVILIKCIFKEEAYVGRIIGTTIPLLFLSIYIVSYFARKEELNLHRAYVKFAVNFSFPIIPHGISQVILSQFDRIMIRSIIGEAEAGLYSFSYNIYTIIQVTSTALDNVWSTWFFEAANNKEYEKIKRISSDYILGMLAFSSFILLISPELIIMLSPKSYWDSIPCVVPIVIGGFFSFLYTLPVQVEYYCEKTKLISVGTTSAAIINIGLNAVFIPVYGYIAAAYTTLITYFLYFIFHYIIAKRFANRNFFNNRILLLSIIVIITIGAGCLEFVNYGIVRWIFAVMILISVVFFAEQKYRIISKLANKIRNI